MNDIKYLVISGGGPMGLRFLGALQQAKRMGKWKQENIKGIYATSIGSLIGAFICLNHDDETLNTYLEERPWHESFKITPVHIFEAYMSKGVLDEKIFEIIMKPLLESKGLDLNVTLEQLFKYSNIDLTMLSVNLNTYQLVPMSHKSHPQWKLIQAIASSCALPGLFKPVLVHDECYVDGGIKCNYPLQFCINDSGCNNDEILGVSGCLDDTDTHIKITANSNLVDFIIALFVNSTVQNDKFPPIKNQIWCPNKGDSLTIVNLTKIIYENNARKQLILDGIEDAKKNFQTHCVNK